MCSAIDLPIPGQPLVELGERGLGVRIDEDAVDLAHGVVAGGAGDRPVGGQVFAGLQDLLHGDPLVRSDRAQPLQVLRRVDQPVRVVDPQPGDPGGRPLLDQRVDTRRRPRGLRPAPRPAWSRRRSAGSSVRCCRGSDGRARSAADRARRPGRRPRPSCPEPAGTGARSTATHRRRARRPGRRPASAARSGPGSSRCRTSSRTPSPGPGAARPTTPGSPPGLRCPGDWARCRSPRRGRRRGRPRSAGPARPSHPGHGRSDWGRPCRSRAGNRWSTAAPATGRPPRRPVRGGSRRCWSRRPG